MRCPKCGYISFDFQEKCSKCNKSLKSVSKNLVGTVYNVPPPSFLKVSGAEEVSEELSHAGYDADVVLGDTEPDLGLHLDDGAGEVDFQLDQSGPEETIFVSADETAAEEDEFILEVPEELSDISDLAAPVAEAEAEVESVAEKQPLREEEVSLDFDLSGDDLDDLDASPDDFDFGDEDPDDLSSILEDAEGDVGMERRDTEDDFDFDLDLNDLTLDDK